MKVEENVYLCKLFDCYAPLLSARQNEILDLYLNDNLTISEIAENFGITRQAVLDGISKAEKRLNSFEEKLHFLEKSNSLQEKVDTLAKKS